MAKGEVDLVIRAKNEATKNLDAVNKALKSLSDQQTIVGDSAGQMDGQLGKLGAQLAQLQTNAQNLKSLATIQDVLDGATQAMIRQRAASAETSQEYDKLAARQQALAGESRKVAEAVKAAGEEFTRQDNALKAIKGTFAEITKENRELITQESRLENALARSVTTIERHKEALAAATLKQTEKAQAVSSSEKATKVQINSLEAANRALEKRRTALAEAVDKERALKTELEQVKKTLSDSTASALNLNAAVVEQAAKTNAAKDALTGYNVQAKSLVKSEREIAAEMEKSAGAVSTQAAALNEVESEYRQLQSVAEQAKSAVAQQATTVERSGEAAAKAAAQVAIFTARMAVLQKGSGTTSARIIDPAEITKATASLQAMGVTIKATGDDATKSAISADELGAALTGVGDAKSKLEGIGSALKAQQQDVSIAKNAWKTAETEVRRLAIAIKAAGTPSDELAAAMGRAQGAARLAKDEFIKQTKASDQIGASLKAAGIGAGDLASAEAALAPSIQTANALMVQGQRAAGQMAAGVDRAGNSAAGASPKLNALRAGLIGIVGASNRLASATNPLRMFTTQLGAMVTAGVGLYGIKTQLESIWEAGSNLASSQAKFSTAFGGFEKGSKELEYAREVAVNLKLPIDNLTKGYADLALSAKGTSMEGEGIRKVFEAFAQTARVNQSSGADLEGVFKALTQIMSKGKVQAEELRGQLGDRLPGAMQILADGLEIPLAQLDKMMEKGELTREVLMSMAAEASSRVAPALSEALDTPAAKLADFQNRMVIFKETIAQSGFLDAIADAFERLAQALSKPEAIEAAKALGKTLGDIVTWATELVASGQLEAIGNAIAGLGIAWVGVQIVSIVSGLYSMTTAIGVATIAFFGLDVALSPILLGLGVLGTIIAAVAALFGAWKLAKWAYDNFPVFAEGVLTVRKVALDAFDGIVRGGKWMALALRESFTNASVLIQRLWFNMVNKILGAFPALTKSLGLGDFAADIAGKAAAANAAVVAQQKKLRGEIAAIDEEYDAKVLQRQKELNDSVADYHAKRLAAAKEDADTGVDAPADKPKPKPKGAGLNLITDEGGAKRFRAGAGNAAAEAEAKKAATRRLALEKSVNDQMYTIRSQLDKKSAQSVDEMVAAVPLKYAKLYDQLKALGKDATSEDWKAVDALVAQEQQLIRNTEAKKAATAQAKSARAEEAAETKRRKEAMEEVNTLLRTRKNIQEQLERAKKDGDTAAVETLKANLVDITKQAEDAIASMMTFWQSVGGPEADAAIAKLETMKLTLTNVKVEGILTGQAMADAFTSNLTSSIDNFVNKIAETGDIIGSLKEAFRQFAIDFLKQIAQMILQQLIFNAISGALGGGASGATAGSVGGMIGGLFHNGGRVGSGNQTRSGVNPAIFANAVRYHGGGVAGLRSNEVPAILEAGETVRTTEQEKALAARQAAASGNGNGGGTPIKIINQIDSGEMVASGIGSAAGEKAFLNAISSNRDTIKRVLG